MIIEIVRAHDSDYERLKSYYFPQTETLHLPKVGERVFVSEEHGLRTVIMRDYFFHRLDDDQRNAQTIRLWVE